MFFRIGSKYNNNLCNACYKSRNTNFPRSFKSSTSREPTPQAKKLHEALTKRGVPAELEKWDRHKHIDIAIPSARINIEVDGQHHNFNDDQAFSDLQRTFYSFEKGYYTLRIPNSLIENRLNRAVELVIGIIEKNRENLAKQKKETKRIDREGEETLLPMMVGGAKAIHRTLKWINKKRKEQP